MNKLVNTLSLLVVAGALSTLAGCELYFGDHGNNNNDTWNYCGSDGFYQCQGDSCEWVSSTCPSGSGSGRRAPARARARATSARRTPTAPPAATARTAPATRAASARRTPTAARAITATPRARRASRTRRRPAATGTTSARAASTATPDHTCTETCTCQNDSEAIPRASAGATRPATRASPARILPVAAAARSPAPRRCRRARPARSPCRSTAAGPAPAATRPPATCRRPASASAPRMTCAARSTDCSPNYTGLNCHSTVDGSSCTQNSMNCVCDSYVFASCGAK